MNTTTLVLVALAALVAWTYRDQLAPASTPGPAVDGSPTIDASLVDVLRTMQDRVFNQVVRTASTDAAAAHRRVLDAHIARHLAMMTGSNEPRDSTTPGPTT